jgi:transposase
MQKLLQSRKELFEALDKPALHPLPSEPYVLANWKKARVNIDYHIELDGHYYSVPYHFAREQVDVRLTQNTLEVFHKGKRIASHRRLADLLQHRGRHSTLAEHMPKAHQRHSEWTPGRLINWAEKTGVYTAKIVEEILASRPHPEQGYRSCMGIIRLGKSYSSERLEAACKRACHFRAFSYKSVQSILQNKLDSEPLPPLEPEPQEKAKSIHPNVRGPSYYQHKTGFND